MASRPRRIASPAWITWAAASLFATFTYALAEEECLNSRIQCYDCNSEQEPRCRDPFNHSEENRPTLRECQGCCVKIVKRHGKHDQEVRRTCTERLQINMFLVDHVCMYESGGGGHMCFCESDACNAAPPPPGASTNSVLLMMLLLLLLAHVALQRRTTTTTAPPPASCSSSHSCCASPTASRLRTS
ncbi:glycosylphosphatidylinositol-anchored protein quiver isoform X1 [Haemaphysalis longicornis]